jgi:hypothetical protein
MYKNDVNYKDIDLVEYNNLDGNLVCNEDCSLGMITYYIKYLKFQTISNKKVVDSLRQNT